MHDSKTGLSLGSLQLCEMLWGDLFEVEKFFPEIYLPNELTHDAEVNMVSYVTCFYFTNFAKGH